MKKVFEGYVNGVLYTSKEEFDRVVAETISSGADNISIHSKYYTVAEESDNENLNQKVECADVDLNELVPADGNYNGIIPLSFQNRLVRAGNRSDILNKIEEHKKEVASEIRVEEGEILELNDEIAELRRKIETLQGGINQRRVAITELKKKDNYFTRLKNIVDNNRIVARKTPSFTTFTDSMGIPTFNFSNFLSSRGFWDF